MTKMAKSRDLRWMTIGALAACGVAIGAAGAFADVDTMQNAHAEKVSRQLDAGEVQARTIRVAGLFGETEDERKAREAREAHEQSQDTQIQQLNQRVNDLEDTLRRLTGQMEQLDHKLNDANSRIERMQHDFDYRLCTLSAQQLGANTGGEGGLSCGGGSSAPSSPPPSGGYGGGGSSDAHLAPPPGVLGTLPSNTPVPLPPPDSAPPPPQQSADRAKFDAAMGLLSKAQYDEARAAFRAYADANPKDDLAPQAVYWIGDISYVQKDYPNAARAFVEEIKKYGSSPRAPESMLKLGQSLIAMNQKEQGCTTLGALPGKYPQASPTVLAQAKADRKTAGCGK